MANLVNNIKHGSPSWMVALTTLLTVLAAYGPQAVASLPGSVSHTTQEWLQWIFGNLAIVMGVTTLVSKSTSVRTFDGPGGTDPVKPKPPTP